MHEEMSQRVSELQRRLCDLSIDCAIISDEDSIAWFAGFWGYLGIEFGRPTLLIVPAKGDPSVLTPLMESEMATAMTWIEQVVAWQDAPGPEHWDSQLERLMSPHLSGRIGVERLKVPALISRVLHAAYGREMADISSIIADMRMIKSPAEIAIMHQAGQIAIAMLEGGKARLAAGVPEYEVALGVIEAGTRTAAGFLSEKGLDAFVSPTVHNLQVLQSGADTAMVHRRSSIKTLKTGDPVYFCFCGTVNFKQYKLGFDREYFIGEVSEEEARTYETCIAAQAAALAVIRPGIAAQEAHWAANEVYQSAGFEPGYRTGRAVGISNLEAPELKQGDQTVLREGMTFAVDGGITVPGKYGARVGDTIVVTKEGYEFLTPYPKGLTVV